MNKNNISLSKENGYTITGIGLLYGIGIVCAVITLIFYFIKISIMVPLIFAIMFLSISILFSIVIFVQKLLDNKFEKKIIRLGIEEEVRNNENKKIGNFIFTNEYLVNKKLRKCIRYNDIYKISGNYYERTPMEDSYSLEGYYINLYTKIKKYRFYIGEDYQIFEIIANNIVEHSENKDLKIILPPNRKVKNVRTIPEVFSVSDGAMKQTKYQKVNIEIFRECEYDYENWNEIVIKNKSLNLYQDASITREINLKEFVKNKEAIAKVLNQYEKIMKEQEDEKRIQLMVEQKGDTIFDWLYEIKEEFEDSEYSVINKTKEEYKNILLGNLIREDWITRIYIDKDYNIERISYSCDIIDNINIYCEFSIDNEEYNILDFYIEYVG